jgi:hypothetical protein
MVMSTVMSTAHLACQVYRSRDECSDECSHGYSQECSIVISGVHRRVYDEYSENRDGYDTLMSADIRK